MTVAARASMLYQTPTSSFLDAAHAWLRWVGSTFPECCLKSFGFAESVMCEKALVMTSCYSAMALFGVKAWCCQRAQFMTFPSLFEYRLWTREATVDASLIATHV